MLFLDIRKDFFEFLELGNDHGSAVAFGFIEVVVVLVVVFGRIEDIQRGDLGGDLQHPDRFLEQFAIKRIKDLPAAQWERAKSFVEKLVAEFDAPATTPVEVDPFA